MGDPRTRNRFPAFRIGSKGSVVAKDRRTRHRLAMADVGAIAVAGVLLVGGFAVAQHTTPCSGKATGCTVTEKDRAGADRAEMRVYTSCGVFAVADNRIRFQFNAADRYGSIHVGETCDFDAVGFRIPLASMFPNIVGVTESTR